MIRRLLLGFLSASAVGGAITAADWPQWRGPARDGKSADTGLLKTWPEGGPKMIWKIDAAGAGYGQPAVVGENVYLIGSSTGKKNAGVDSVLCLSAKDGSKIWSVEIETAKGEYLDGWGGGPRSTPTIEGEFLYALGETGDLVCLKVADGSKVWSKNLVKDFGGDIPQWGYSESVLIDGDRLIVSPGGAKPGRGKKVADKQKPDFKGGVVALNKKTGELEWACKDLEDPAGYSSVMTAEVGGVRTYVQQTMANAVGIAAKDGKLLWKTGEISRSVAVIPTPVLFGNQAFFTAGYGAGCELIDMSADGNGGVSGKVKYKNKTLQNHHGGVIPHNKMAFGHSDSGGWTSLNPETGEAAWQFDKFPKGSVSYADGAFYCYSENNGDLTLVDASASEWKVLGKLSLPEKSKTRPGMGRVWPHPVIANGVLYLRDYELLFAYNLKSAAE